MDVEEKKLSSLKLFLLQYFKFIIPAIIILILVFGFMFFLNPKYNEVKVSGALNLEAKQVGLANKEVQLSELKKLAENYSQLLKSDIEKIEKILPSEEDIPGLLVQLENTAKNNIFNILSLDINSIQSLSKNKQNDSIKKLAITLTIEGGGYTDLKLFLSQLESNLRLFDVEALNFTSGSNLYTLNISTYYSSLK